MQTAQTSCGLRSASTQPRDLPSRARHGDRSPDSLALNRRSLASATVLLALLGGGCTGEDERATGHSQPNVAPMIEHVRSEGAPGVVALVRNRSGTWRFATGAATLEPRRAMRVGDRLRVASVTKTFVATVVLQLVAES